MVILQCANQGRAQGEQKHKVVEVPGLQGRILTVVREAQQLAWVRLIGWQVFGSEQLPYGTECEDGGGRRSPLARQAGKTVHVLAVHFVDLPTVQAKTELAWDEPVFAPANALKTLRTDMYVFRNVFAKGAFDLGLGLGEVEPGFWKFFDAATVGLAGLGWAQKAVADVLVVIAGDVVDFSGRIFHLRLA